MPAGHVRDWLIADPMESDPVEKAKIALKRKKTGAAPTMKAGHEAVMQRWPRSVQKLRLRPSAMIPRPPSRTTRALAVRSLWPLKHPFQVSHKVRCQGRGRSIILAIP